MGTIRLIRAKLQATTIFSGGAIRDLARRDQLWILPIALVGGAVGIGSMVFVLVGNYRMLFQAGLAAGRPEILFSLATLAGWLLVLLLGVPVILSVFFYSKDTPMLLALPIRPLSIVIANASVVYLTALAVHALVTVPALAVYAASTPVGPWFFAAALVFVLAGPLFPLAVSLLLCFGLTAVVNLSRYRTALEVAGFVVMVACMIVLQVVFQRSALRQVSGSSALPEVLTRQLLRIPQALPPLYWAAAGFVLPWGPLWAAAFAAFSCGAAVLAGWVAGLAFLSLTVERGVTRSRGLSETRYQALRAPRGALRALFGREVALLASNSSTLFEGVSEGLVFPLILVIFSFTLPSEVTGMLGELTAAPWAPLAVLGVLALMTGINTVSSTSISREGRTLALSLMLPVPGRVQLAAKLLFHLAVFGTGFVVDLVLVFAVLRFPLAHLAYFVPAGAGFLLLSFCSSILIDLRRPYLTWTHPQQAMKQNMNALAAMGVSLLVVAVHAAVAAGLMALGLPALAAGCIVAALTLAEAAAALPAVYRYADRRYGGELEALAA